MNSRRRSIDEIMNDPHMILQEEAHAMSKITNISIHDHRIFDALNAVYDSPQYLESFLMLCRQLMKVGDIDRLTPEQKEKANKIKNFVYKFLGMNMFSRKVSRKGLIKGLRKRKRSIKRKKNRI